MVASVVLYALVLAVFGRCDSKPTEVPEDEPTTGSVTQAAYVGSAACRSCHAEVYDAYQHTGKGRSFHAPHPLDRFENFAAPPVYDPTLDFHYRAFWRHDTLYVAEFRTKGRADTTHYREERVAYVIGSGNQTRSYLREVNGYLYEMPLTWYAQRGLWDLSPGYEAGHNTRFDRLVGEACLSCHGSGQAYVEHSLNRFTEVGGAIGCETCHGPGSTHVQYWEEGPRATKGQRDSTIVNPKYLTATLQFDVCRQCHLEGVVVAQPGRDPQAYRPGQPLADYQEIFLPVTDATTEYGFASHAERLQQSPCFLGSGKVLTCTPCHAPHQPLATQVSYNATCQSCHPAPDACTEHAEARLAVDNNCVRCHMPKRGPGDIPHVATTDHKIGIHRDSLSFATTAAASPMQLKSFTSDHPSERNQALAYLNYYEQFDQNPAYLAQVATFVQALERDAQIKLAYLQQQPLAPSWQALTPSQVDDPATCFYVAEMRLRQGLPSLDWHRRAVNLAPDHLEYRFALASAYETAGQPEAAAATYLEVLQRQPEHQASLLNLGYLRLQTEQWEEALALFDQALALYPDYRLAYENRVQALLQLGELPEALRTLDRLIKQYPDDARYPALRTQVREALSAN